MYIDAGDGLPVNLGIIICAVRKIATPAHGVDSGEFSGCVRYTVNGGNRRMGILERDV